MGASQSNRKEPPKKDNNTTNAAQKFAEEIDENTGVEHSKNAVDQNITSERDQGTEDYKQHLQKLQENNKAGGKDAGVNKDRNEEVNKNKNECLESISTDGILSSQRHSCNLETDDCKGNCGENENNLYVEDMNIELNDEHKSKCERECKCNDKDKHAENKKVHDDSLKETQSDTTQSASTNAPEKRSKSPRRHVRWNNKVTFQNVDGSTSEEEHKSCDSCKSIIKKGVLVPKQKVVFSKKDSETITAQDSSSADKEDGTTIEIYICDSCDLQREKEIIKNKEHNCTSD